MWLSPLTWCACSEAIVWLSPLTWCGQPTAIMFTFQSLIRHSIQGLCPCPDIKVAVKKKTWDVQ